MSAFPPEGSSYQLLELAKRVGGRVVHGTPYRRVRKVQGYLDGSEDGLSFVENAHLWAPEIRGAVLVSSRFWTSLKSIPDPDELSVVVVDEPRLRFAELAGWLHPPESYVAGVHPQAVIDPTATVDPSACIQAGAGVGAGAKIGKKAVLRPGAQVLENASIGEGSVIHPNVVVGAGCHVGAHCILMPGVVIGSEGFGFVGRRLSDGTTEHVPIPQLGTVVIEDNVRIGANSCVDRATFGVTRIRRGTKIDNLVQIAHNVEIGTSCLIVAQAGVAGSATLGAQTIVGGQAGVAGHLHVGAGSIIGGQSGVMRDLPEGADVVGQPAVDKRRFFRDVVLRGRVAELLQRVRRLERLWPHQGNQSE